MEGLKEILQAIIVVFREKFIDEWREFKKDYENDNTTRMV
jgi:hypothetical protein